MIPFHSALWPDLVLAPGTSPFLGLISLCLSHQPPFKDGQCLVRQDLESTGRAGDNPIRLENRPWSWRRLRRSPNRLSALSLSKIAVLSERYLVHAESNTFAPSVWREFNDGNYPIVFSYSVLYLPFSITKFLVTSIEKTVRPCLGQPSPLFLLRQQLESHTARKPISPTGCRRGPPGSLQVFIPRYGLALDYSWLGQ